MCNSFHCHCKARYSSSGKTLLHRNLPLNESQLGHKDIVLGIQDNFIEGITSEVLDSSSCASAQLKAPVNTVTPPSTA